MENDIRRSEGGGYPHTPVLKSFYRLCGIIISLCAIAEFIIWIVGADAVHATNEMFMGIGFLAISVGVFLYLLIRPKSYVFANWLLWIGVIACIVLMFIGIAI